MRAIVDIRETSEREKTKARFLELLNVPYANRSRGSRAQTAGRALQPDRGRKGSLIFVCTFGERSGNGGPARLQAVGLERRALSAMAALRRVVDQKSKRRKIPAKTSRIPLGVLILIYTSLRRHEFDPLDREILERAFDAALAVIGRRRRGGHFCTAGWSGIARPEGA